MTETPQESRVDTVRWLVSRTWGLLMPLVASALARIVSQLLGVALYAVMASALVRAAGGGEVRAGELAVVLIVLALLKAALRYAEHYAGHWVAFTALQRLRELFVSALIPQAPAATRGRAGAALTATATRDIDRIEVFFAHTFPPAVSAFVVPTVALVWLGAAAPVGLALVLVPFALAALLVPLVSAGTVWRAARSVAAGRAAVAAHLGDDIHGVRDVLERGAQDRRLASLAEADDRLVRARSASGLVQGGRTGAIALLHAGALIAVLVVAARTDAGLAGAVLALAVAVGLRGPLNGVDSFMAGLDAALASAQRLRAIVEAPPAVADPEALPASDRSSTEPVVGADHAADSGDAERPGPAVRLRGVTLTYPAHADADSGEPVRPALADADVDLPAGEWSSLVGVSGSGKSTLASLLLRVHDPDEGEVRLGGRRVQDLRLDDLRGRVALVDQRPTLLIDSLRENIRLARPEASDAQVLDVLRVVGLEEWATGLSGGLDAPLRAGRTEVSGGQLQRLALARALLAEPEVLVLDEALSQLDEQTAQEVRRALERRRPGRTTIEVTHRVDRIPADAYVVVVDAGRVVEQGRAGGLLETPGSALSRLAAR
ncbi:ATP-binding cassette domain-containing protein [Brevibacterium senegalense]|uniref:ATP-binding cassette domain-containing protein n=1 Tax=Brevibacterium senegalense TaxID=1033736 RepID=UPI0002FFC7EF|nr:ABC transporter ATP-binding protein [Brevibacterium senegalense]